MMNVLILFSSKTTSPTHRLQNIFLVYLNKNKNKQKKPKKQQTNKQTFSSLHTKMLDQLQPVFKNLFQ